MPPNTGPHKINTVKQFNVGDGGFLVIAVGLLHGS